jgi:multidrug transporter EmrE-like cation transporter
MFVQAIFWTYVTYKFLNKEKFFVLAVRIFILSAPLGISYAVFMVGAKHVMTSVSTFALFETPLLLITHFVISILISACYTLNK